MQQIHVNGAVRHAEKRRSGTCEFANRVALASLDAYELSVPKSYRDSQRQTCVAAIVAHFENPPSFAPSHSGANFETNKQETTANDRDHGNRLDATTCYQGNLQVMGLGVGTKFLSNWEIQSEQRQTDFSVEEDYGKRIRDCHAEVLARRAFRRQISIEILLDLRTGHENKFGCANRIEAHGYRSILERVVHNETSIKKEDDNRIEAPEKYVRYRLKPNVTLHFYASSAPCGNATLKKFTKMEKEIFDASWGPDKWPNQNHVPIAAHSLRLGQFALLVKKDGSALQLNAKGSGSVALGPNTNSSDSAKPGQPTTKRSFETTDKQAKKRREIKNMKPWPCRQNDSWCPPACSITNYGQGTLHSCSDKLCRWNCLGLQGAFLAPLLDSPLYMTTLTVGRKFSRPICQRAVCCRADGFGSRMCKSNAHSGISLSKYRLNHPVLMETCVYMDEQGTHDMAGVKTIGLDASFSSNLCWVWWPGKSSKSNKSDESNGRIDEHISNEATEKNRFAAECIDGKTGFVKNHIDHANHDKQKAEFISDVSTFALLNLHMHIIHHCGLQDISLSDDENKVTLARVRSLKRRTALQYETAKDELFSHRVFRDWSRRG